MDSHSKLFKTGLLIAGLLLAFALRAYTLFFVPLSLDEILTINRYVPLSLAQIFTTHHSNNQPFASALAHLFSPQANNLFLMRWPMLLLGMLVLPFVYRLGRSVFNSRAGVAALLLMALAPVHLAYSVVVRGYGGLIFLVTVSVYVLIKGGQQRRWGYWLTFLAVNLLVVYFHMFGAFAAAVQLGLAGLWLGRQLFEAWQRRRLFDFFAANKVLFWQLGFVTVTLLALYPLLITTDTQAILSEGGHPAEFEAWRTGLSWQPVLEFVNRVGPMSPFGWGAGLYLALAFIGLARLWRSRRMLAIAAVLWLGLPFPAIYIAMQLLGLSFYAYVRFLLYLLPGYVILVSVGILTLGDMITAAAKTQATMATAVKLTGAAGLLVLLGVSGRWYLARGASIDWFDLANTLSAQMSPQDIVVCEEHQRGFGEPDRAKAYCVWMLDFYMDELHEYSSGFHSSTDFVAQYNSLQQHRHTLVKPGGVWLVIWKKLVYNPGHLITHEKPVPMPVMAASVFAPHQAYGFGSAYLVYVNSESSLLGNLRQAVMLLLEFEPDPADKARYLRSLAQIEAIQGRKQQAQNFAQRSRQLVNRAGNMYPDLFLADTQSLIDRIPAGHYPPDAAQPVAYAIDPSLCLGAYRFSVSGPGQGVLTLWWQVLDFIKTDYSFFLELYDHKTGQAVGRLPFDPFNRQYPTVWWWPGQPISEQRTFVIPPDLPEEQYLVKLGGFDRNTEDIQFTFPLFWLARNPTAGENWEWRAVEGGQEILGCNGAVVR